MNKLRSLIRRVPKRTSALVAMIAAAVVVPAVLFAWGPDRPTFTIDNPADHITFNSITDNPDYGDERNFVRIKDAANQNAGGWSDDLEVQPGKEYLVQMYVHNNAATSLNLVAKDTTVMANVPTTTGKSVEVNGFISASNATPGKVWDQATFTSSQDFNLAYVSGSAVYYNNVFPTGTALPDSIVTSAGAKVGYDKMDGNVPGCFEYSGYVSFKVKPQFATQTDYSFNKQVRKAGDSKWSNSVNANPGDTVEYQLSYKNTGDNRQDNVILKDQLPTGLTYVAGSTYLKNGSNPSALKVSDNLTSTNGINIGDYAPEAAAYVKFSAKVAANDKLVCGKNTLTNKAQVIVDDSYKEDTADVVVTKECEQPKVEVCNPETGETITVDKADADKYKPVGDKACQPAEECKPGIPVGDDRCEETPITPPELPKTGMGDGLLALLGAGSLIGAVSYYIASRRAL